MASTASPGHEFGDSGRSAAVIDAHLANSLGEYLRFRHLFRNVYRFVLEAERMRLIEERLPGVLVAFRGQVRAFLSWAVGD